MKWYHDAVIYHIYPLGFCGAPRENQHEEPVSRILKIKDWIPHLKEMRVNAVMLNPLFESGTHGYDTFDYKTADSRLGTNDDLKTVCHALHEANIRIVFDACFDHVGRGFFAFQDVRKYGPNSAYHDWFKDVRFGVYTPLGDPFWYEGWNTWILPKLNHNKNAAVRQYILDVIGFWIDEFEVDGLRFDTTLEFEKSFLKEIHQFAKQKKPDIWLMGEIVHGNYAEYATADLMDSITNYEAYKGIWSSHNDKNYYEIEHTLTRQFGSEGIYRDLLLYNFVDNHDVNRLASEIHEPILLGNCYTLMYTMPGIPSVYYGSEYGIQGKRTVNTDYDLRPCIELEQMQTENTGLYEHIVRLGKIYSENPTLRHGTYRTVSISNEQFAFSREYGDDMIYIVLNQSGHDWITVLDSDANMQDLLSGTLFSANAGKAAVTVPAFSSMILARYQKTGM